MPSRWAESVMNMYQYINVQDWRGAYQVPVRHAEGMHLHGTSRQCALARAKLEAELMPSLH